MRKLIRKYTTSKYYANICKQNEIKISELYFLLADQKSRETLTGILDAYKTIWRTPGYFFSRIVDGECCNYHFTTDKGYKVFGTSNPYFLTDIFSIDSNMVYLDGGAYIGDTIQLLEGLLKGACKHIYAFEPNSENYEKLQESIKKYGATVQCFNVGLDNFDGTVSFVKADAGSKVSEEGNEVIEVLDIGKFLASLTDNFPTFIKLDIEGKEAEVIEAMSDFIKQRQPDLAISVYHKLEDLWEIPLQIQKINPTYKIYLRHQSNYFTETVCYATLG